MRAKKNHTVEYIDNLEEQWREEVLKKAITFGRKQRDQRRKQQKELREEVIRRQDLQKNKRDETRRKGLEKKLKKAGLDFGSILGDYPEICADETVCSKVREIMQGQIVGLELVHVWFEDGKLVPYNGKVRKLKKSEKYKIAYWTASETSEDAVDYDLSIYELSVDCLYGDLLF